MTGGPGSLRPSWTGSANPAGRKTVRSSPGTRNGRCSSRLGDIDLEVSWCTHAPRFGTFSTSLVGSHVNVTIEIPDTDPLSWRGRLPAVPGTSSVIPLGEGLSCEIEVGEPKRADRPLKRTWRRASPSLGPPPPAGEGSVLVFDLSGSESGKLGEGQVTLRGPHQVVQSDVRRCSPAWLAAAYDRDPLRPPGVGTGPVACGQIRVQASSFDATREPSRIDLVLVVSEWTGDTRLVQLRPGGTPEFDRSRLVELPSDHAVVTSRHVFISPEGEGSVSFAGDIGRGPELFTLALQRRQVPQDTDAGSRRGQ